MFNERLNPKTEVKIISTSTPHVIISQIAYDKMWNYVDICDKEIGWLGTITKHPRYYSLDDVYLFEQEVHATTTEISPDGLASFGMKLLEQPNGMEEWNKIRLWGHSHVRMGVTPSGQDDAQMRTFAEGGNEYFFRLIANKNRDLKIDLFHYEYGLQYTDVPWEVVVSHDEQQVEEQIAQLNAQIEELAKSAEALRKSRTVEISQPIKDEIQAKVKTKSYTYTGYQGNQWTKDKVWVPGYTNQFGGKISGYWRSKTAEEKAEEKAEEEAQEALKKNNLTVVHGGKETTHTTNKSGNSDVSEHQMRIIIQMFTDDEIESIGYCQDMKQVSEEIEATGIKANFFTHHEKRALYEYAYAKLAEKFAEKGHIDVQV